MKKMILSAAAIAAMGISGNAFASASRPTPKPEACCPTIDMSKTLDVALDFNIEDNNVAAAVGNHAVSAVAGTNSVTQVMGENVFTFNNAKQSVHAANPATAGNAVAGSLSGSDAGAIGGGIGGGLAADLAAQGESRDRCGSDSGSGAAGLAAGVGAGVGAGLAGSLTGSYASSTASLSTGVRQDVAGSQISGVSNAVNSINTLAQNSASQLGAGTSFSSTSTTNFNK